MSVIQPLSREIKVSKVETEPVSSQKLSLKVTTSKGIDTYHLSEEGKITEAE